MASLISSSPYDAFYGRWRLEARHRRREWMAAMGAALVGVPVAWCAANGQVLPAVGLIYALLFWMTAWRAPGVALALTFASALFQRDVSGGGVANASPAEVHLALLVPILALRCYLERRPPLLGVTFWPCCLYLLVCAVSVIRFFHGKDAILSYFQMVLYFFVAVGVFSTLPRREEELLLGLRVLVGAGVLLAIAGIATKFTFLSGNKNGIGASLACAFLIAAELWMGETRSTTRRWLTGALLIIGAGLFLSLSRGSWLGTICGLILLGGLRRQWGLMFKVALCLLPIVIIGWQLLPQEQREYAVGFDPSRMNISLRYLSVAIAKYYWNVDPLFGAGVGLRKQYDATNLMWVLLAETGVAGLLSFGLIHVLFFAAVYKAQKHLGRNDPLYSLLVIGAALLLYKGAHGMVDHYWSRGAVTLAWAACGMSAFAIAEVRRRAQFARAQAAAHDPWAAWMASPHSYLAGTPNSVTRAGEGFVPNAQPR